MHQVAAFLALSLLTTTALATPSTEVQVQALSFDGMHASTGSGVAMRLQANGIPEGLLRASGASITVTTVNATGQSFPTSPTQTGFVYDSGGDVFPFGESAIDGHSASDALDVFVSALTARDSPRIRTLLESSTIVIASQEAVAETAYVDATRPVAAVDVAGLLQMRSLNFTSMRVEGSFVASIWGLDFQVTNSNGGTTFETGVHRRNPVQDPATGTQLTWVQFEQVAQVQIVDGWLEYSNVQGSSLTGYHPELDVTGQGMFSASGVTGRVATKPLLDLRESTVQGAGTYALGLLAADGNLLAEVRTFAGDLLADGMPVNLSSSGPLRSGSVAVETGSGIWRTLGPLLGILGLFAMAALVKGPAMSAGFHRLEAKFEAQQYATVLARIDPFTRRRRFERRATFLKVVSLLSMNEFKEASLFLQTLGPRESPEPATKNFLLACAAAGLGQDDEAISHLSTCFRLDPSYIEEAKTVPALVGYLPYFSLGAAGEGGR